MPDQPVTSAPLEHVEGERDAFEQRHGVTYCRRCGRLLTKDSDPDYRQTKPCRVVQVGLR